MPDTPATTETSGPGPVTSELAHAVAEDDAIWEKHFGKEAKGKSTGKSVGADSKEPERRSSSKSRDSKESSEPKTGDGSAKKPAASKATTDSKKKTTDDEPPKERAKAKDSTADTGPKTAKAEADAKDDAAGDDPEEPSKKARDLYAEAKKSEDPREARKLYKRALKEAFGEVPPEFDDRQFADARKVAATRKAALDEQATKNEGRIKEAAERLKPAIYVMRQIEQTVGTALTVPLVEKCMRVMKALKPLEDGDFTALAEVVAQAAGVDHDEAMKRFVRGVRISPEGRAARAAAEQSQRDNLALKERLAQLERQLEDGKTQQTEAQKKAERERQVTESRTVYLERIEEELDGHAVLKLPRGRERVLAYLIRTADKKLRSPTMSFETAANRIVAGEKRRLADTRFLDEGDDGNDNESRRDDRTERRSSTGVSRAETRDAGVREESPQASFDRIFSKHTSGGGRRR